MLICWLILEKRVDDRQGWWFSQLDRLSIIELNEIADPDGAARSN
jgi:hypothetical protein